MPYFGCPVSESPFVFLGSWRESKVPFGSWGLGTWPWSVGNSIPGLLIWREKHKNYQLGTTLESIWEIKEEQWSRAGEGDNQLLGSILYRLLWGTLGSVLCALDCLVSCLFSMLGSLASLSAQWNTWYPPSEFIFCWSYPVSEFLLGAVENPVWYKHCL